MSTYFYIYLTIFIYFIFQMDIWTYKTCIYTHNVRRRAHMCVHGVSYVQLSIFDFFQIIPREYLTSEMYRCGRMKNDIYFIQ